MVLDCYVQSAEEELGQRELNDEPVEKGIVLHQSSAGYLLLRQAAADAIASVAAAAAAATAVLALAAADAAS